MMSSHSDVPAANQSYDIKTYPAGCYEGDTNVLSIAVITTGHASSFSSCDAMPQDACEVEKTLDRHTLLALDVGRQESPHTQTMNDERLSTDECVDNVLRDMPPFAHPEPGVTGVQLVPSPPSPALGASEVGPPLPRWRYAP